MNRIEHATLASTIKALRLHNRHLWWELKWQIWDYGNQEFYPRQSEYELPTQNALERLDSRSIEILESEWIRKHPSDVASRDRVISYYKNVVIDEIVRRAAIAAYRTKEW